MHFRKNDSVMVIAGKERGKTGKVLRVAPDKNGAIIERVNMVKRHTKGRGPQQPGGILEKEAFIQVSNIMVMCVWCAVCMCVVYVCMVCVCMVCVSVWCWGGI